MLERDLTTKIMKALRARGAYVVKIWGGGMQTAGIPDLLVCYGGRFVALEVKVGKNATSRLQELELKKIHNAGGVARVIRSVGEAIDAICS